jgi:hypothetical protein
MRALNLPLERKRASCSGGLGSASHITISHNFLIRRIPPLSLFRFTQRHIKIGYFYASYYHWSFPDLLRTTTHYHKTIILIVFLNNLKKDLCK